ncbi:tRNA (uracil-5-)-methyltransferase TRM9 [Nematocida minor]|uniref:tRNA (uracil-5-)-methyltransferase TRM9 n=1 Tax=Nematocida minor TaxID=1912983 RepID=UPI0022205312|nr:tRNA (uracil-5-)-methyltransferase TRM9 [Nematocida minor]KAI5191089.1 tRNA (uracil-5-)-methyltransferase TRM9 [Nematocida minor]
MKNFEKKHVHAFYEESSKEFSATRYKMWPKVEHFYSKYVKNTDVILDAGSGNGRNTLHPLRTVSLDYSKGLLGIAKEKQSGMMYARHDLGDVFPIRAGVFDICISIAVIHHLSTSERREASVRHMIESLKTGGHCMIYVWSESPESKPSKFLSISNISNPGIEKIDNLTGNDVFVGWKSTNNLNRYYHLFRTNELEDIIAKCPVEILESGKDHGNYYVICRKTASTNNK